MSLRITKEYVQDECQPGFMYSCLDSVVNGANAFGRSGSYLKNKERSVF